MARRLLNQLRLYSATSSYVAKVKVDTNLKPYKVHDRITVTKKITAEDVMKFIEISGDSNPIHLDGNDEKGAIVHGAYLNALVSGVIGTQMPGPGSILLNQFLNYTSKCYVGDEINITVEITQLRKIMKVEFACKLAEGGKTVMFGLAEILLDPKFNKRISANTKTENNPSA